MNSCSSGQTIHLLQNLIPMANNQFDHLDPRHAAITQQAQKDTDKKEKDDNAVLGMVVFGVAYALEYVLPNSYLLNSPTFRSSQQIAWEICISVSGGCILLLILLNVSIWICRCRTKYMPNVNRHLKNLLRYTAVIVAANTILRGVLTRMDVYKWMVVSTFPFITVLSYFAVIWIKDAFCGYPDPVPKSLEILLAMQQAGFDGALEAPPRPAPQPFTQRIRAAGNIILRCLIRTVDAVDRV